MKLFEVLLNEKMPEVGQKYDKKFTNGFFEPDPRIEQIRGKGGYIKVGDRMSLVRQPNKKGKVVGFAVATDKKNVITGFKVMLDLSRAKTTYIGQFDPNELQKVAKKPKEVPVEESVETLVVEGYNGDWAILPATMELYGKRTVDILTAASEWPEGATILVCKNEQGRIVFVSSANDDFKAYSKDIGKSFSTHHDQTGASKGMYKVINVVLIKNGKIVKHANDEGLKVKASLAVFK